MFLTFFPCHSIILLGIPSAKIFSDRLSYTLARSHGKLHCDAILESTSTPKSAQNGNNIDKKNNNDIQIKNCNNIHIGIKFWIIFVCNNFKCFIYETGPSLGIYKFRFINYKLRWGISIINAWKFYSLFLEKMRRMIVWQSKLTEVMISIAGTLNVHSI